MNLKKTIAAAVVGAGLALSGAAAMADEGINLTEDEKATLSLVQEFASCVEGKLSAIPQEEVRETVQMLIEEGVPPQPQVIQQYLQQIYVVPAQSECIQELNIDVEDTSSKIQDLVEKYGPGILDHPAP